jgi:hypothetical protein
MYFTAFAISYPRTERLEGTNQEQLMAVALCQSSTAITVS